MEIPQLKQTRTPAALWSFVAAGLLCTFYLATSVWIASHRLLWYDETLTVLIPRLPNLAAIWKVLGQAADTMSPPYYLVVRIFDSLFGHSDFAARIPSALAMTAGLFITFECARRLSDGLHGLIALSLLTCSVLPFFGYEARAYALYFVFAALSLLVWAATAGDKLSSAVLFGAALFLCITTHYYAVLCLVPYATWEIANWKPWQLPSWKMIGGVLGMLFAAVAFSTPIVAAHRLYSPGFWAMPSLHFLKLTYTDFFPDGFFLLVLTMAWIALVGPRDATAGPMQPGERVGWLFLLIPISGYVLATLITKAFYFRYFIGMLPGVAVAFSCWLWRHFREARRVSVGILVLLTVAGLAKQVTIARHPEQIDPSGQLKLTRQVLSLENVMRNDGKKHFLICLQLLYMETRQYSKNPGDYALLVFSDDELRSLSGPPAPNMLGFDRIRSERALGEYYPVQFWTLDDLKKHARETAVIAPFASTLDILQQSGFQTTVRFAYPEVVYLQ